MTDCTQRLMTLSDSPTIRHALRTRTRKHRTGFHDNEMKSQAWQDIAHGNVKAVTTAIDEDPCYAKMRAADGRGPLFWAHEFYNQKIIDSLASTAHPSSSSRPRPRSHSPHHHSSSRVVLSLNLKESRRSTEAVQHTHAAWCTRWWS